MKSLALMWRCEQTNEDYFIGILEKVETSYTFFYNQAEAIKAIEKGFSLLIPFPDISDIYIQDSLFPIFKNRLPDKNRKNINDILKKYGLDKYDEYELLAQGSELPVDNLRFKRIMNKEEREEAEKQLIKFEEEVKEITKEYNEVYDKYLEFKKSPEYKFIKYQVKKMQDRIRVVSMNLVGMQEEIRMLKKRLN